MKKTEKVYGFPAEINAALNRINEFYGTFPDNAVVGTQNRAAAQTFMKRLEAAKKDLAISAAYFEERAATWRANAEYLTTKIEELSKIQ